MTDNKNRMQFKTNINCSACIRSVTPWLNTAEGIEKWDVDTENPDKILTVISTSDVTSDTVKKIVQKAGFEIKDI